MAIYDEKELIVEYVQKRKEHEELKQRASEAFNRLSEITQKLVEYMEDTGATSTAKYEGLGRVSLQSPILHAKFDEENRPIVFDFLRKNGMDDVIKETVHHSTLSSFIAGLIKEGKPIPPFISTTYRKTIRFKP